MVAPITGAPLMKKPDRAEARVRDQVADSDEVARAFRDDVARVRHLAGMRIFSLGRCRSSVR